jgi:hypothetical protein
MGIDQITIAAQQIKIRHNLKMNDQTKLALFDSLLAYLIQSSSAMDGTIKALATGALVSPLVLNEAIDYAKVLLSKVIHPFVNDRLLLLIIVMGNPEI